MRIGKFAEKNNISIDTVRHYMDMGLIIPEKKGGQYDFDHECQKDIVDIITFKQMGLKLNEIKKVLAFERLGRLSNYQKDEYYRTIFINKHKEILKEIEELNKNKERLEVEIKNLSNKLKDKKSDIGIELNTINIFRCLKCGEKLVLDSEKIKNNQIITGKLKCKCGKEYRIEEGILIVDDKYIRKEAENNTNHIGEYIISTDEDYVESLYRGLEWFKKKFVANNFNSKTILELGSGFGFLLRSIYNDLPDDCTYIAIDNNIEQHKFVKKIIEHSDIRKNIVFICTDFLEIPLEKKSIDILIDASGTSNYSFDNEKFLLNLVDDLIKNEAYFYGGYILFEKFSHKSNVDINLRQNFRLDYVKKKIKELGFIKIDDETSKTLDKGGKYEDFFIEGEKILHYKFYGKRKVL